MDALRESLDRLEELQRKVAGQLAVLTEHAEPGTELAIELCELSSRIGILAAATGQLAAEAAQAAARLSRLTD